MATRPSNLAPVGEAESFEAPEFGQGWDAGVRSSSSSLRKGSAEPAKIPAFGVWTEGQPVDISAEFGKMMQEKKHRGSSLAGAGNRQGMPGPAPHSRAQLSAFSQGNQGQQLPAQHMPRAYEPDSWEAHAPGLMTPGTSDTFSVGPTFNGSSVSSEEFHSVVTEFPEEANMVSLSDWGKPSPAVPGAFGPKASGAGLTIRDLVQKQTRASQAPEESAEQSKQQSGKGTVLRSAIPPYGGWDSAGSDAPLNAKDMDYSAAFAQAKAERQAMMGAPNRIGAVAMADPRAAAAAAADINVHQPHTATPATSHPQAKLPAVAQSNHEPTGWDARAPVASPIPAAVAAGTVHPPTATKKVAAAMPQFPRDSSGLKDGGFTVEFENLREKRKIAGSREVTIEELLQSQTFAEPLNPVLPEGQMGTHALADSAAGMGNPKHPGQKQKGWCCSFCFMS